MYFMLFDLQELEEELSVLKSEKKKALDSERKAIKEVAVYKKQLEAHELVSEANRQLVEIVTTTSHTHTHTHTSDELHSAKSWWRCSQAEGDGERENRSGSSIARTEGRKGIAGHAEEGKHDYCMNCKTVHVLCVVCSRNSKRSCLS